MRLRTARRGPRAGNQFWGCSRYPRCRGSVDAGSPASSPGEVTPVPAVAPPIPRRVAWSDGTTLRDGWIARYTSGGGSLRSWPLQMKELTTRVSHCWIARERLETYEPADDDTRRVVGMMRKVLQRGTCPPLHPESERALFARLGMEEVLGSSPLPGDVSPRLRRDLDLGALAAAVSLSAQRASVGADIKFQSQEERQFLTEWVPRELGSAASRWFIPQAPLDRLLAASGLDAPADRRVDFLVSKPYMQPLAIEIDGDQHDQQGSVDSDRDSSLANAGYRVIRVPATEVVAGKGNTLEEIRAMWSDGPNRDVDPKYAALLYCPAQVHRLVLGLLEGVMAGFLAGDRWVIELHDPLSVTLDLIRPYLDLLAAIDELWGGFVFPREVVFVREAESAGFAYSEDDGFLPTNPTHYPIDMRLRLEVDRTPTEVITPGDGTIPSVVIRSAFLPVEVFDPVAEPPHRITPRGGGPQTVRALRTILQAVFAKRDFREGQLAAITEVLEGRDCAVLLPTGAGKSLIYQLAGLCLPGRTIVVDPIIALMEDQIEGLKSQGIDRIVGISSREVGLGYAEAILDEIRSGSALFAFIAPERLQQQSFRSALRELAAQTPINLAVVDESHCVSEWGHDFRTSYLNLGKVIRNVCRDAAGVPPPILALTGTASRSVLRDVLLELGIEQRSASTLVRPATFDRPELHYEIIRTNPTESLASLSGYLRSVPSKFNLPLAEFYRGRGDETHSGIVFCPHVNGDYGVVRVADNLQATLGIRPAIYSGEAPRGYRGNWEEEKRRNARAFKDNTAPLLVSTKAFGMGIDKANIRFVVHYGIPGSIEAYYQEVGRAGRDGQVARCGLIMSEFDEARARELLDEESLLEETRGVHGETGRNTQDDITRALFFHLKAFRGIEEEVGEMSVLLDELHPLDKAHTVSIPMPESRVERERAIHRLILLGVIQDYLVDWGGNKFDITVGGSTEATVAQSLLSFIERSQPGRAGVISESVNSRRWEKLLEAVLDCGKILIEFVYDAIERSRRRSLREIWLTARESASEDQFRQRILDYLSEGDLAPLLERLVEQERFHMTAWMDQFSSIISEQDANEWRGNTARLLASYPDHPGLLLGRAISELVDSEGDCSEFQSNLHQALTSAVSRYGTPTGDLKTLVTWIWDRWVRDGAAHSAALLAMEGVESLSDLRNQLEDEAISISQPSAEVAVISLERRLKEAAQKVEDLDELLKWRYA